MTHPNRRPGDEPLCGVLHLLQVQNQKLIEERTQRDALNQLLQVLSGSQSLSGLTTGGTVAASSHSLNLAQQLFSSVSGGVSGPQASSQAQAQAASNASGQNQATALLAQLLANLNANNASANNAGARGQQQP